MSSNPAPRFHSPSVNLIKESFIGKEEAFEILHTFVNEGTSETSNSPYPLSEDLVASLKLALESME
jgi:hypothetical protein